MDERYEIVDDVGVGAVWELDVDVLLDDDPEAELVLHGHPSLHLPVVSDPVEVLRKVFLEASEDGFIDDVWTLAQIFGLVRVEALNFVLLYFSCFSRRRRSSGKLIDKSPEVLDNLLLRVRLDSRRCFDLLNFNTSQHFLVSVGRA